MAKRKPMVDLVRLREYFDDKLKDIWEEWNEGEFKGSPFEDLVEDHPLWEHAGFQYDLGYLRGISAATGWDLRDPKGPREWKPK